LRGNVGVLGFRAVGVAVGYGARGAGAWVLFVEGVGVDEGAVAGLGLGAVVEDPDNGDHGEEDVTGCRGFKGSDGGVDEGVYG